MTVKSVAKKSVRRRKRVTAPVKSEVRKIAAQWLPFAFTVVVAVVTWLVSGVSATTSFRQQVVALAAHQIEQDARLDKIEDMEKRAKDDFVPRAELTRILNQQDLRTQRIEDKLDRVLENQSQRRSLER